MQTLTPDCRTNKSKPFKLHIADPKVLAKAFHMYMSGKSIDDICCACDISAATLKRWAQVNQWQDQYNALINESMTDVKMQYRTLMTANVLQVAHRQLMTAERLDAHIKAQLETDHLGTKALADLARAAAASFKIAANVVGLGKVTKEAGKKQSPIQYGMLLPHPSSSAPQV